MVTLRNIVFIILCFGLALPLMGAEDITPKKNSELLDTPLPKPNRGDLQDWLRLGNQLLKGGHARKAITAFRAARGFDAKNKSARFGIATALIKIGEARKAMGILEPMIEEFPNDYALKNNLAWLYATSVDNAVRNGEKAIALAQDAILIVPRDSHVWSTLSESYFVAGQYEKAQRAAEEALRLSKKSSASQESIMNYKQQITKCKQAVDVMSLMD